jgi:GAF domain-containing protein
MATKKPQPKRGTNRGNTSQSLELAVEERTRELAALVQTANAITSTLEVGPLMEALLENLKSVIDYDGAGISIREGDYMRQIAVRRPPGYPTRPEEGPSVERIDSPGAHWRTLMKGRPFIIDDTRGSSATAKAYRKSWGGDFTGTAGEYIRCLAVVPLLVRSEVTGLMTIASSEPKHFTQHHLELLGGVADIAASAIENARLFEETERRTKELSSLLEASRTAASSLDPRDVVAAILGQLDVIIDHTGSAIMTVVDGALEIVDVRAIPGHEPEIGVRLPLEEPLTGLWEAILRGEAVIIDDLRSDEAMAVDFRRISTEAGLWELPNFQVVRSWLGVPLMVKNRVTGILAVSQTVPAYFTAQHARLVRALADHAAIAIENARLFKETERRERELSALLQVSRSIASTLDVQEVLEAILEQLGAVTEHTGASILLARDEGYEFVAARSSTGTRAQIGARVPFAVAPAISAMVQRGESVIIDDIRADETLAADYRAIIESVGRPDQAPFNVIRSWMGVPLALKDRVLGVLTVSWTEPAYFTEDHARLARAFADQAVVAIENARLYEEAQQAARESEALSRADAKLFRSLDLETVLQALVDVTVDVIGVDKSLVATWDSASGVMTLRAARNLGEPAIRAIREMYSRLLPRMDKPEVIVTEDPSQAHPEEKPVVEAEGIQSFIQVPILSGAGSPLGFFSAAYTEAHRFEEREQRLLTALADRAAAAISNADLYERAQQAASLEERQRLARELHDSVSQALYGIALGARTARTLIDRNPAEAAEPMDYVLSLAEAGMAEMRALIFELRPESLETEGLVAAITKQASALEARNNIGVRCELNEPELPIATKEAMYRIAQEAMTNIAKHAKATSVEISLGSVDSMVRLTVTDDGAGFDTGGEFPGHLGLRSMSERAEKAGGKLTIESSAGAGTTIRAEFPAVKRA